MNYDENINNNKFFIALKSEYKEFFEEAISLNWVICVPKCELLVNCISPEMVLEHILIPLEENAINGCHFKTLNGKEVVLKENSFMILENSKKKINIFFEETFYESKLGKYKVVCIDECMTNLFKDSNIKNAEFVTFDSFYTLNDALQYIYEKCKGISVVDSMDRLIVDYLSSNPQIQGETAALQSQVYSLYENSLNELRSLFDSSKCEENILQVAVESYITQSLYKQLFQIMMNNSSSDEEIFNRKIHDVKDLKIEDFDLELGDVSWSVNAKYELAAIGNYKHPFGKLRCIKRTIKLFKTKEVMSSDELIPLLVFCIIKCNISNWYANLLFMKTFNFTHSNSDEYNYIVSSLEAALLYIKSGEVNKLLGLKRFILNDGISKSNQRLTDPFVEQEALSILYKNINLGNCVEVKQLLESKKLPEPFPSFLGTELLCHPLCSCTKCKDILNKPSDMNIQCSVLSRDEKLMTPLHVAALAGKTEIVEYLLNLGAEIDCQDYLGMTPLHYAAQKGHQNALLLLLHLECNINVTNNDGNTPLHLASLCGHDKCVKALIFYCESTGCNLLLNAQNNNGDTPLHIASHWGYSTIVKLLVAQAVTMKLNIYIQNKKDQTPLNCAHNSIISDIIKESISNSDTKIDKLYLVNLNSGTRRSASHLDPNSPKLNTPKDNCTTIHDDNKNADKLIENDEMQVKLRRMVKAILAKDTRLACFYLDIKEFPAYVKETSNPSPMCHPLCHCVKCDGVLYKNEYTLNDKSLLNYLGKENYGVLHASVLTENLELCQVLLQNEASPQLPTMDKNETSLHLAILRKNLDIAKLLISFNADVNSINIFGNTPLHLCCIHGWIEGAILLINSGADLSINNMEDHSPMEEAEQNGHIAIVKLLFNEVSHRRK